MPSAVRITTGQFAFDGGVDSYRVPLIAGPLNPNGLKPNQLAWGNNISVRAAGISPRNGWQYLCTLPITGLFQGGWMYQALGEFPYIMVQVAGHSLKVNADNSVEDVSIPGDLNSATLPQNWFTQGEQFMVVQEGPDNKNPLFWDGETMRRSQGDSRVIGVVNANFVVPAVGQTVLVTLNAPFAGQAGETIYINGKTYSVGTAGDYITLKATIPAFPGSTVPAGAVVEEGQTFVPLPGGATTIVDQPFIIPASGGSVTVPVRSAWTGPVPSQVVVNGSSGVTNALWDLTAVGLPPAGPNQVYLINLTDTPAGNVLAGTALETAPELPKGEAMDYYMGRIWIANGRQYLAGDIVGGSSGSAQYDYTDSILKNTENAFIVGGGAFIVPSNAGNIRALNHPANLDTALGQGQLLVFTRQAVYSTNVSPLRAEWAALSEPIQRVIQKNFGTVSDRSVVPENGDMFYQAVDGVRSIVQAIRYQDQWGNTPLSNEEQRVISRNDRALMRFASGIEFNNRLLQTCLPFQTPAGVAFKGIMPLNFDLLSGMSGKLAPAWEGVWEGLNVLQLFKGDFGGRQRAFAAVWSEIHGAIEIWELTDFLDEDIQKPEPTATENRVTWSFETPSFDWRDPFQMKELDTMELWVDRLKGKVEFTVEFRPDQYPCWLFWHHWEECAARDNCEDLNPPVPCDYPTQVYLPQYRIPMVLPKPPTNCNEIMKRPMNRGFSFQFRITIKGSCRVRGFLVHALPLERQPYAGITC